MSIHNARSLEKKLRYLQPEIQLSDDELAVIMFSSVDHDYFTQLLISQGELLHWFNINFEGENREELDFLMNKERSWTAAVKLAETVLEYAVALPEENLEEVLRQDWWNRVRFFHFGSLLAEKLNAQPELKVEFRNLFKASKDKLSYYDFFQFIEKKLQIQLEDWEEDALEARLDRLCLAFIEFKQMNEFCLTYELEFGEPLLSNDIEDQLDMKHNIGF